MFSMYTLCFAGQPIAEPQKTWQAAANLALAHGLATRLYGCIFTLLPGASIAKP